MNSKIKNENVYGYVVQAVGPIIDVQFKEGELPSILTCLIVEKGENKTLTLEVEQHIGDDTVRCVAMGPTEGIVRGMKVLNTKNPICVPVGEETLGRMFNVLGSSIDELGDDAFKNSL